MSDDQDIEQLEDDIEQTRGNLADTIGQIEARLSPSALQDQVSDIVKQVTDQLLSEFQGKSGELTSKINDQVQTAVQSVATSRVEQLIGQAKPVKSGVGKSLWGRVSENPAVGSLAAVGIGLLAAEEGVRRSGGNGASSQGSAADRVQSATSGFPARASDLAKEAADAIGGAVDSAREQAQGIAANAPMIDSDPGSTSGGIGDMVSGQSLASGLLAMGIGFLVGVAAPDTVTQREAIAPLKDKAGEQLDKMGIGGTGGAGEGMIDQAKRTGGELLGQAARAASGAVESGKQAADQARRTIVETAKQAASGDRAAAS